LDAILARPERTNTNTRFSVREMSEREKRVMFEAEDCIFIRRVHLLKHHEDAPSRASS